MAITTAPVRSGHGRRGASSVLPFLLTALLAGCAAPKPEREFVNALPEVAGEGHAYIPGVGDFTYATRQDGSAPLEQVFRFWGIRIPRQALEVLMAETALELATIQEQMMSFADHQGLWAFAQYGTMRTIEARVAAGVPVIVLFQEGTRDAYIRRYAIVTGFNREKKWILCNDGTGEPQVYTYSGFRRLCRPLRFWMLTVCPPDVIDWEMSYLETAARARFYDKRSRFDEAIADWEQALVQQPENVNLLLAVGNTYRRAGVPARAEQLYRRAIGINNLHARACNNLAYLLAEQHRGLEEALLLARRATLLEPNNPSALDTLGLILIKLEQYREAADILEKARRRSRLLDPEVQATIALRLAEAYRLDGQDHLVIQVLNDLQATVPDIAIPDTLQNLEPYLQPAQ